MTGAAELATTTSAGSQLIEQARQCVERAQARAGVRIDRLSRLGEQGVAAEIWKQVWDRDGEPPVSAELVRAAAYAGNYVSGAFDGGRIVGALFGFYAGESGADHVHSHILGVDDSVRGRGVGFALKQHQRLWALERGMARIEWTFDPLVRANGFFNVAKLAAEGVEYLVDFYGPMTDSINAGDETDRVVIRWDLADPRVAAAAGGIAEQLDSSSLRRAGAAVALDTTDDGRPRRGRDASGALLCRVPADILDLRARTPQVARSWRRELREVMAQAMSRGLRLRGMTRDGWYVLAADPGPLPDPSSRR